MPEDERREKRRIGEGWEYYTTLSDRYGTGVPLVRLIKPINPREETEKLVGKDSSERLSLQGIASLISSKKLLTLAYSATTVLGIALTVAGVYSLFQAAMTGSPYPQMNADPLVLGSIEMLILGLLLSAAFGALTVRNFQKIKMLRRMLAISNNRTGNN